MMRKRLCAWTATLLVALAAPAIAQQGSGHLKTKVNPGRAGVFIDGKYVGAAQNFRIGSKFAVPAGEHEVRLVDPRCEDIVTEVDIRAGKTTKLKETMKPLPLAKPPFGRLRTVSADKFAAVYVNGKFMGHAGEFNNRLQGLLLNPGEYKVKIIPRGSDDAPEENVRVEADKVVIVRSGK